MNVSIERAALLKAMSRAQGVVERRNTIPILGNVLLEAEGDRLSLRATDLDIEIAEILPAQVVKPGSTTVAAHLLHEIVRKLPDGAQVSLALDPAVGRLDIRAGRSRFHLPTLPREDFPVMASSVYDCTYAVKAPVLRRLFDKSKFAVSTEETRYYLNGVYLHVAQEAGEKVLRAVATDGHRLARIDADLPAGAEAAPGVIVPTKIRFSSDGLVLTSKVIDGAFPDYTRVIPTGNTRRMEVGAAEFAHAVDRVATVSQERSRTVKMALEEDRLVLSVTAPDAGSATEELAVAYPDEAFEIGFNAKYLLEIAGQIDRDNAVFLFADSGAPTLVRDGDDLSAVYVVMPMRV
jgi:DNA polymerase-3 subunit beta